MTPRPSSELGGPPPTWSPAQRWVLASQGVLTELFHAHPQRMGGLPRPHGSHLAALFLRRDWGVRTRREALERTTWLLARGHRFEMAAASEHTADDLLAWDMVRAAAVAGWSYVAYHLEADEAWAVLVRAARELQGRFASWAEVGASYLLARNLWKPGGSEELDPVIARLIAEGGGWDLPWDIDLDGELPPPTEPLREVTVDGSGAAADFATIREAVAAAGAAGEARTIVVRPGTYVESVVLSCPVELVADGDVTIQGHQGPPIAMTSSSAHVRGFRLVSGTNAQGTTHHAVDLERDFLKLVDCTLRSARCGVYAHRDGAFVSVERCRIESAANTGILSENGAHAVLVETVVRATGGVGVLARGAGELCIEESRIEGAGNTGLSVAGDVVVDVDGLTIERSGHNGIELLERTRATLARVTVRDAAQAGLLAATSGGALLTASTIVGSGSNDLGVFSGRALARDCTFGGGPGCGLCVCAGAVARLDACTIDSSAMPSATIMGNGHAVLVGCELRGGRDIALWVMPEGNALVLDSTIAGGAKSAVLLRNARRVRFEGGAITSETGCLFVVGADVVLRRTRLSGGSPAVCAQEGGEMVLTDASIETDGEVALAVEGGSTAALTRTEVVARRGTALTLEAGRADLHRTQLRGASAATVDDASVLRSWACDHEGAIHGSIERLDIDESLHAPGTLTLVGKERMTVALDGAVLESAFTPHGLEPTPPQIAAWLDLVLAGQARGDAIEIAADTDGALLASADLGSLQGAMARVREVLGDPSRTAGLARQLAAIETDGQPRRDA